MEQKSIILFAEVSALNARIEGMKAENMQREHLGQSMAFSEENFIDIAHEIQNAIDRSFH